MTKLSNKGAQNPGIMAFIMGSSFYEIIIFFTAILISTIKSNIMSTKSIFVTILFSHLCHCPIQGASNRYSKPFTEKDQWKL